MVATLEGGGWQAAETENKKEDYSDLLNCPACGKNLDDIDLAVGIQDLISDPHQWCSMWNCPYCGILLRVEREIRYKISKAV